MIPLLKRFFTDPDFFLNLLGRFINLGRFFVAAVGGLFASGYITLTGFGAEFGPLGHWLGVAIVLLAFAMRSGNDTATVLKNLDPETTRALLAQLQQHVAQPEALAPK